MDRAPALVSLHPGQLIPFGGDRVAVVDDELASAFTAGDRLVVVQNDGALLHIPGAEQALVTAAIDAAVSGFRHLASVDDEQISQFYDEFAATLVDDAAFAAIAAANEADVAAAAGRGRSTTRLVLSASMRHEMVAGLRGWRDSDSGRDATIEVVEHDQWTMTARRAPLGVVGFVFEGRPNVLADATGVLRTGNTAVLRIGRDALGTARAIMEHALRPALVAAGLPETAVMLIDSPARSAGWALFSDGRIALAIARGSGAAVAQLGAVARQAAIPVSLHGTGGAWLVAGSSAETTAFSDAVRHSLDRKVCNTLNVCCIVADRAADLVPLFLTALREAGAMRDAAARVHVEPSASPFVPAGAFHERVVVRRADGNVEEPFATPLGTDGLGNEWEWEGTPEVTLVVVDSVAAAVAMFNDHSPRLVASLVSDDAHEHREFYATCEAPFIGNGFTRWVDGQFALNRPELGLSNWEHGRLFARSAVLSGDSVFTVRLTATVSDTSLRR